ncbi:MAG TPA: sulfur oxidation c-type cytochrome SoxA, partial [Rhodocyclaceae bacterium]|nr:sulfur oxidation c-type cytochrome SoxA [Rhodocyclaceae bacterium]
MRGFMRTALATAAVVLSAPVWAEGSTQDEIARYREMLAEGNPAELLEAKGEELWKKPRGPRNVSLERCDLGLGPGQVQGAYARLPRYFADTRQVMDVESRLVHCMVTLQGFTREEATRNWYSRPGKDSDIEALVTYIGGQSNGVAIDVPARHPEEARMARIGELIFYRRSGPQDFSCAICHGQEGKRIRLQEL